MIVNIHLTEAQTKVLLRWASVGRTFDAIETLLETGTWKSDTETEQADYSLQELKDIHAALEALHMSWRGAVWEEQGKQTGRYGPDVKFNTGGSQWK